MKTHVGWMKFCVLIFTFHTLAACETVAPYERGALAKDVMNPSLNQQVTALHEHMNASKKSTSGGNFVGGGGCGCN